MKKTLLLLILFLIFSANLRAASCFNAAKCQTKNFKLVKDWPKISDDLARNSLLQVIDKQLAFYRSTKVPQKFLYWDGQEISQKLLKKSLLQLKSVLKQSKSLAALNKLLQEKFYLYQSLGSDNKGKVLFTAYYAPSFKASKKKTKKYSWPVHYNPTANKVAQQKKKKYFSRAEINNGAIKDKSLIIAYLDRLDRFVLQLQGSGELVFDNGSKLSLNYGDNNGYPFTSIGTVMKKEGVIIKTKPWTAGFRQYFKKHPEKLDHFFLQQKRYIFFRAEKEGPMGLAGLAPGIKGYPLTPYRSIASDKKVFPFGAIIFAQISVPEVDKKLKIKSYKRVGRLLIDQDTGGPLHGPDHIDLYFGPGARAEIAAGGMGDFGQLYLLLAK